MSAARRGGSKSGRPGGTPRRQPARGAAGGASGRGAAASGRAGSAGRPKATGRTGALGGGGATQSAGPASPFRMWVERTTGPALVIMSGWPKFVVGLAPVVFVVLGLVLPPLIALIPLVLAFLMVLWLSYLSWPVVPPNARFIRVFTLALIIGIAVLRIANN